MRHSGYRGMADGAVLNIYHRVLRLTPHRPARRGAMCFILLVLMLGIGRAAAPAAQSAASLPTGFEDELIATPGQPTALAFTPDGRLLITGKTGELRVYRDGQLLLVPALSVVSNVCAESERGLLGVAVDPEFETNRYIYLYYT